MMKILNTFMCVIILLDTALYRPYMQQPVQHSEVKLILERIACLLLLRNLTVVDRTHRAESVQGKHR